MNKEKVKKKNVEMAFINVVLYPTEKQKPEEYIIYHGESSDDFLSKLGQVNIITSD